MLHKLTPTQDFFQAVHIPDAFDEETASDLADQLQELLPSWRVSAFLDPDCDGFDVINIENPRAACGFSDCDGEAKAGDWVLIKDDGAFAIVSSVDAEVLFDMERAE